MRTTITHLALLGATQLLATAAMSPGGNAPAGGLKALRGLEQGEWELRDRESTTAPRRRICLGDPGQLIQVQHPRAKCSRFVVTDAANRAVVTYQCTDAGTGRTDLRVETPRLIQIDAQGVADSAPFAVSLEARRTGECH